MFVRRFVAGWGDMDFNAHMRNTAFLDRAADLRLMFFAEHGFDAAEFAQRGFGPVVRRDELDYRRELQLLQPFSVSMEVAGLSTDGSRFKLRNRFHRDDGELCASVLSSGGWLDLRQRRLIAPPDPLLAALKSLPRSEDFGELPSSLKPEGQASSH